MDEFDWIRWIKAQAGQTPRRWRGIGDDAAVFPGKESKEWVISTDAILEGVDFDHSVTEAQAGRKALAINLSDMAAMGAMPRGFLMTLGVPPAWNGKRLRHFIQGVFKIAREYDVFCAGGDMSSAKQFFCNITVFGKAPRKGGILRKGAKKGDMILVTGTLGGSIHKKHYAFTPRIKEAEWLVQNFRPSAMLDISDGLAQDLTHLLRASQCAARLDLNKIPLSKDAKAVSAALSDGEDFELLMTMPSSVYSRLHLRWKKAFPKVPLTPIGTILSGAPRIHYFKAGVPSQIQIRSGFRHF